MKKVTRMSGLLLIVAGVLMLTVYHLCGSDNVSSTVLMAAPVCIAAGIIIEVRMEKKAGKY